MPRKRKKKLRPRLPSRVKKTRTKRSARARRQHPELWGLGAIALGLFLGAVLYFGWNGGYVGGWLGDGLDRLVGDAKYVVPVALAVLGALVVTRSALVDVHPFRTGLAVLGCGLMVTLGKDQGGYLGQLLGGAVGVALGATGSLLLGVLLMLVGSLLLSGASLGAILRRSGRGLHHAARRARSRKTGNRYRQESVTRPEPIRPAPALAPPVDAVSAFPDVVGGSVMPPHAGAQPAPLQTEPPALFEDPPTLFDEVTSEHAEYKLPDAGVLRVSPEQGDDSGETAARVAELLVQTLAHFGVEANVIGQISGPRVTRYELQLAPGTKVAKVSALKDDLSYALATTEIRILAPIPGKQAVGVEVPNLSPNLVTLGDIFDDLPQTASPLAVWLGEGIPGNARRTDLARVARILRARNLPEANRALRARGDRPMPYLLIVIDELADLMMISPQDVEDAVIRLAQKSRAVGIHLVLATQRPSVDVITGMIKANVPSRIAFAVSSQTDSRVILDGNGAESLLGQGDMLFKPLGTSRLQRLQGAYVSEEEIALVVEQCRAQREQELDESLLEAPEPPPEDHDDADGEFDPDEDPLLERAIEIVVTAQTASTSLLQRRLRVGYTRAGRLIDMLERRGIISGYEGSKPRRVLIDEAELPRVIAN